MRMDSDSRGASNIFSLIWKGFVKVNSTWQEGCWCEYLQLIKKDFMGEATNFLSFFFSQDYQKAF